MEASPDSRRARHEDGAGACGARLRPGREIYPWHGDLPCGLWILHWKPLMLLRCAFAVQQLSTGEIRREPGCEGGAEIAQRAQIWLV